VQKLLRIVFALGIMLAGTGSISTPAVAAYVATPLCSPVAAGDHETYHLPVTTGLPSGVTFSSDWSQQATGGWYGRQAMDGCRIKPDGNVTWHGKAAARIEVQPKDDPLALGENTERSEMLIMQTANGSQIQESTASGTVYYATSYYFPPTWAGEQLPWSAFAPVDCSTGDQNQCNSWSFVMQFWGWGALMAARTTPGGVEHYSFAGKTFTTNSAIALGQWTDFVFQVNWTTGAFVIYRRDQGNTSFTQVLSGNNGAPSGSIYYKQGLYRGGDVKGRTDVLWVGPTARGASFSAVEQQAFGTNNGAGSGSTSAKGATHDFNGDGKSDLLLYDTSGNLAMWLMNGAQVSSAAAIGAVQTSWQIVGQRDFNGDGKTDLLLRDSATGNLQMWLMNGTQAPSSVTVGNVPPLWTIIGTGDFNGDGHGDILWRDASGNIGVSLMNGATALSSASLGGMATTWSVVGLDDFDGNGTADILWRNTSGDVAIWFMNGTKIVTASTLANVPHTWSITGTGDFNGDGKSDIVWRNRNGHTSIWLMNGATMLSSGGLDNVPSDWSLALVGDYDGDGKSDLLWRDSSGNTTIWFMNGVKTSSTASIGNIPTKWSIQSLSAE
jgi:hypothetical protein